MRYLLLSISFFILAVSSNAQPFDSIITELKTINNNLVHPPVNNNGVMLISNRAMNIFMADKTGYVSAATDLSYYTNYVTFNTSDGKLTVSHNFQKASGIDEPIKTLFSVGAGIQLPSQFSRAFLNHQLDAGLGIQLSYKWLGKIKTSVAGSSATTGNAQQQNMDALRAGILHALETEIKQKKTAFENALDSIDSTEIPGQSTAAAKSIVQQNFYASLLQEYEQKFASLQAIALTETNNFKVITANWTGIDVYLPLLSPEYAVAPSLAAPFQSRHSYPVDISVSHTRLWESSAAGRLFITLSGQLWLNNSKLSFGLDKINFTDYNLAGGADTLHQQQLKNDKAYIGNYRSFVTTALQGRIVYFPAGSHIGISFLIQQNFGAYRLLNGKVSIPIVLINAKKTPAANLEFYVAFTDLANQLATDKAPVDKTIVGLSIGIPFSRLMF